jgi:predicted metal-dependent enzyme (double-stranded beta helix superfamily)
LHLHPTLWNTDLALPRPEPAEASPLSPAQLAAVTDRFAAAAERWRPILRHDPDRRWSAPLLRTGGVEVWLLGWSPGQQVPAHDHGGAAGAFTVVDGTLVEECLDLTIWTTGRRTTFRAGSRSCFGPDHVHVLGNHGPQVAASVHAYSPPALPQRFGRSVRRQPAAFRSSSNMATRLRPADLARYSAASACSSSSSSVVGSPGV